jgi:hypothetical protein
MYPENSVARVKLHCEGDWLDLECHLPVRRLKQALVLLVLAAATVWGSPEVLRFVQILLSQ